MLRVGWNSVAAAVCAVLLLAGCADTTDYVNEHPQRVLAPVAGAGIGLAGADFLENSAASAGLGAAGFIAA